ncbi:MAG: DUF1653 domain-containing protein [Chlamydiae bacterium]|nr:DUF1653 domain-containing protein [Chlamydiota bacterium]
MEQKTLRDFSNSARSIEIHAIYEHYKGMRYKVLGIARHSETLEELIVYQALYGAFDLWVRPLGMFLENVTIEGKLIARFKKINGSFIEK